MIFLTRDRAMSIFIADGKTLLKSGLCMLYLCLWYRFAMLHSW